MKTRLYYVDGEWWCTGNLAVGVGATPRAAFDSMLAKRWAK